MPIIVQKFGGTSVADCDKILAAARKAISAQKAGNQVVMVLSAMGEETDRLIDLARQIAGEPPARELDMLLATGEQVTVALMAMAIHSLGHRAISMTGAQIGILTDSSHTKARIHSISTDRVHKALAAGNIVIAAGFQGIDESGNITTLGRGGSDTTAVALAAVLNAEACEIYTDVDGIYTTDPRVIPEARRMRQISYDEILELASAGAGVMHNRSIEFAKKFCVPVHVRSSFTDARGTMIVCNPESTSRPVCGAALIRDAARITALGIPDRPGSDLKVFSKVAAQNIPIDMIVQNESSSDGQVDFSFTVLRDHLPGALRAAREAVEELGGEGVEYSDTVSMVSIVGRGMATQPGVAGTMFRALADRGINIEMITTSEIKISVIVQRERAQEALQALHEAFELHVPPAEGIPAGAAAAMAPPDEARLVAGLQRLEKLIVEKIDLDETQGRVTFIGLADIPGRAARMFDALAEAGIVVDMIVQSIGRNNHINISVTVPRADVQKALAVAVEQAESLDCPPPTHCAAIDKLSVVGVGMKSHAGLSGRMFQALADNDINVELISTSEVRVNVVVDGANGRKSLAVLKEEFASAMV